MVFLREKVRKILPVSFFSLVLALLLLTLNCTSQEIDAPPLPVEILSGVSRFLEVSTELTNSFGILPQRSEFTCNPQQSLARFLPTDHFHEFFLSDENQVLIVLNSDPFYFLQLKVQLWIDKLSREYEKIARGVMRKEKSWSALPILQSWEDYWMEIYFIPNELNFSLSALSSYRYKIKQANTIDYPRPDLWRLLDAAQDIYISIPHFQDEQLFADLAKKVKSGHQVQVVTQTSDFHSHWIVKNQKDPMLPFPIFIGRDLMTTSTLLDGQDLEFLDQEMLTADFAFIFSFQPGNPHNARPLLNHRDGIVFLLRGDISPLTEKIERLREIPLDIASDQNIKKSWCSADKSYQENIPLDFDDCLTSLDGVFLSEIGDNRNPDDYIELYNSNDRCVNLTLSQAVLQRDSGCKIADGKITGKHLLEGVILPRSYLAFGEQGNGLSLPETLSKRFSINGQSYCLALTATTASIRNAQDPHIFDFVTIGTAGDSNHSILSDTFPSGQALIRCKPHQQGRSLTVTEPWQTSNRQTPGEACNQ